MSDFSEIELRGEHAALVPLRSDHAEALSIACADGELYRLWYTEVPSPETMAANIAMRLSKQAEGVMLPFTVLDAEGVPVGMTSYCNIDRATPRAEIGYTWYAKRVQRTALNSQCKLLLLTHAFETLECVAVEFRTSSFNRASRRAIERLGARLDGILRSHRHHPNGVMRDTCVYSIIAGEWPGVRAELRAVLGQADPQKLSR